MTHRGWLWLASAAVALMAGLPASASAQQATLYEVVENFDLVRFMSTLGTERVSSWTAQGTAQPGSPFCPLPTFTTTCVITAFGMDRIDLTPGALPSGTVWANIVVVANDDNAVDGPEGVRFSGQITGMITVIPPGGAPVSPALNKNKRSLGPSLPLIYVTEGKFFADVTPTIRTAPVFVPDAAGNTVIKGTEGGPTSRFRSTFRLPFNVGKDGKAEKPERGRNAYYLGDDGSLIKVDKQDEFALGFPLLRADVYFLNP